VIVVVIDAGNGPHAVANVEQSVGRSVVVHGRVNGEVHQSYFLTWEFPRGFERVNGVYLARNQSFA
jgi:hypothetical protein